MQTHNTPTPNKSQVLYYRLQIVQIVQIADCKLSLREH